MEAWSSAVSCHVPFRMSLKLPPAQFLSLENATHRTAEGLWCGFSGVCGVLRSEYNSQKAGTGMKTFPCSSVTAHLGSRGPFAAFCTLHVSTGQP